MTNETWSLPENSLCSRRGSLAETVDVGVSPERQTGSDSAAMHGTSAAPRIRTPSLPIVLMAGLTPKMSGASGTVLRIVAPCPASASAPSQARTLSQQGCRLGALSEIARRTEELQGSSPSLA